MNQKVNKTIYTATLFGKHFFYSWSTFIPEVEKMQFATNQPVLSLYSLLVSLIYTKQK